MDIFGLGLQKKHFVSQSKSQSGAFLVRCDKLQVRPYIYKRLYFAIIDNLIEVKGF